MKQIHLVSIPESLTDLEGIKEYCLSQGGGLQFIDCVNWPDFPYKPDVSFFMGWNSRGLYLFFDVLEQEVRVQETEINGMVCNDSCVEMFISEKGDNSYYNFEFNAAGVFRVGFKDLDKGIKQKFPPDELAGISVETSLPKGKTIHLPEGGKWSLSVFIEAGFFPEKPFVQGARFRANFYKCGDLLKEPHYVSWNPITTEKPSFHQPAFFGEMRLGEKSFET